MWVLTESDGKVRDDIKGEEEDADFQVHTNLCICIIDQVHDRQAPKGLWSVRGTYCATWENPAQKNPVVANRTEGQTPPESVPFSPFVS